MVDFSEFIEEMVPEPGGYSIGRLQLYMDKRESHYIAAKLDRFLTSERVGSFP